MQISFVILSQPIAKGWLKFARRGGRLVDGRPEKQTLRDSAAQREAKAGTAYEQRIETQRAQMATLQKRVGSHKKSPRALQGLVNLAAATRQNLASWIARAEASLNASASVGLPPDRARLHGVWKPSPRLRANSGYHTSSIFTAAKSSRKPSCHLVHFALLFSFMLPPAISKDCCRCPRAAYRLACRQILFNFTRKTVC